jgi:hypothetical protein
VWTDHVPPLAGRHVPDGRGPALLAGGQHEFAPTSERADGEVVLGGERRPLAVALEADVVDLHRGDPPVREHDLIPVG